MTTGCHATVCFADDLITNDTFIVHLSIKIGSQINTRHFYPDNWKDAVRSNQKRPFNFVNTPNKNSKE